MRKKGKFTKRRREPEFRINKHIRAREVRLVGEGFEQGVYTLDQALKIAEEAGLDLVEIVPKANPPVCKVVDYSKFLYEKKKKEKEIKAKTQKTVIKEIRFTPHTDAHDFDFKLKHAEGFLNEGAKVKAFVHFKGRAIVFKDKGFELLKNFAQQLEDVGVVEQSPRMEGRRLTMFMAPKKGKK